MMLLIVALSQIAIAVYNDLCDMDLDIRSKATRPLVSGRVTPGVAIGIVAVSAIAALDVAFRLGVVSGILVSIGILAGLSYSRLFKRTALSWLPFAVAFPVLPAWVVVVVGAPTPRLWILALLGPPLAIAIHLSDSLPDIEEDRRLGSGGIAVRLGPRWSMRFCRGLLVAAGLISVALAPLEPRPIYAVVGGATALTVVFLTRRTDSCLTRNVVALSAILVGLGWLVAST